MNDLSSELSKQRLTEYRPEIDGLRALAVIPVVLFHAKLGFSGGYTGVDVFFVISGFLITQILLKELAADRFTFGRFWRRRIRRLFPASFGMMLASVCIGWAMLPPQMYAELGKQIIAATLLASNIYFWATADYWGAQAEDSVLLHMWSLAVEEQFYLVMPVLLAILYRFARRWIATVLTLITAVSFLLCVYGTHYHPSAAFYLLPTRAWELLVGACLACVVQARPRSIMSSTFWSATALAGLGLILYSYVFFTAQTPFPGWRASVPCFGTWLFLASTTYANFWAKNFVGQPTLQFIGRISYSLYLWHWPIIVFGRFVTPDYDDSFLAGVAAVVVSFVVATLSWRFIERPFRAPGGSDASLTAGHARKLFSAFGAGICCLTLAGGALVGLHGPSRLASRNAIVSRLTANAHKEWADCSATDLKNGGRRIGDSSRPIEVVVLGSSHGVMYVPAIDEFLRGQEIGGTSFARGEESPLLARTASPRTRRGLDVKQRDEDIDLQIAEWKPKVILCFHRWSHELPRGARIQNEEQDRADEAFSKHVNESVAAWSRHGAKVMIVGEVPQNSYSQAKFESLLYMPEPAWKEPASAAAARLRAAGLLKDAPKAAYEYLGIADLLERNGRVSVISPTESLLYWDDNHLTTSGAELVVSERIGPALLACLKESTLIPKPPVKDETNHPGASQSPPVGD
jgi:peptidoglycan/LPS O-acetylase OafA/YrhL